MVINLASLPQEAIEKYDLNELAQDGKVYIETQKGMYCFSQTGILAKELLQSNLLNYSHSRNLPCGPTWTHGQIQAPIEPPN
jgi:hypothetical protein